MASHAKKLPSKSHCLVTGLGIGLILFSGFIILRLFRDPLSQEIKYIVNTPNTSVTLSPPNTTFSIVIDKLGVTSSIIQDVNPLDSRAYQLALSRGIAHAKGTNLPGGDGNIFLFAHSSADLMTATRYNSVFYLMHHLEEGDIIKIWKDNKEYDYAVSQKEIVAPSDMGYLTTKSTSQQLTLMTCWPPGTTLKRLIIIAKPLSL